MLIYILIYIVIGGLWNKFLCWTSDKYKDDWSFGIKFIGLFIWPLTMSAWLLYGLFLFIGGKKE